MSIDRLAGASLMIAGAIGMLGGLFAVWPEAFGIDLQEHLIVGGAVNFSVLVLGVIVFAIGAKMGDF